ncbi:ABC transporter permease [Streptomyces ossamyceticus]|uniref:ABC transporter permease n=1 Tax=Streptomyces ossamyceticus TaxID=249581 RepID=UPI0006E36EF7|nr:ABC transporter permease [Streptomyces ossamyceticus]
MTLTLHSAVSRFSGRTLWRIRAIVRRLAGAVLTVVVATFAVYAALAAAPGDPALALAGRNPTPERIAQLHQELGLDRPLVVRYFDWLSGLPRGDLGQSIVYRNSSVADLLGPRFGTTVFLVVYAAVLILLLGLLLGVLGGAFRRLNGPMAALTSVALAIPGFVAAPILVSALALGLGWFPAVGAGSGFTDQLWHLTLPALALAIGWCAWLAQITRTSLRAEKASEHVGTATGRGLPPVTVFRRHVLRNAAIPISTVYGLTVAGLLAGAAVVEQAFGIDGLGTLMLRSVSAKDYNVVLAVASLIIIAFVVTTQLVDALHTVLDPRLRTKGGRK